jgi:hypothetical protein
LNVTLISGKFLGRNNMGSYLDAIQAIDYLTTLRSKKGLNIVALNNSWGGTGFSQALADSITRAARAGILFVAAAMNNATNNDVSPAYPANYDTAAAAGYDAVVSVAAITKRVPSGSLPITAQPTWTSAHPVKKSFQRPRRTATA